jgi:hypothetical protein
MRRELLGLLLLLVPWALYPSLGCGPPPPPPPPTGPPVFGIAPNEVKNQDSVWIEGRGFDLQPLTITLTDPVTNEIRPVTIQDTKPNRVKVKLPDVPTLVGRKLFYLRVNDNNVVNVAASKVYISESNNDLPSSQKIQTQFVRWLPAWDCFQNSQGEYAPPYVCGCTINNIGIASSAVVDHDLFLLNPNDGWSTNFWSKFDNHYTDAKREWSAMCTESWAGGSVPWIDGLAEQDDRITLRTSLYYWFELDVTNGNAGTLADRRMPLNPTRDVCFPPTSFLAPVDCTNWRPNGSSPRTINVHLVGAFYDLGQEVDPEVSGNPRGFAYPESAALPVTSGMVVITDNPFLGARPKVFAGCLQNRYGPAGTSYNVPYWWGPKEGRSFEPTPNLLVHELHHVVTDYLHFGQDPCNTPAVGESTGSCPRGFNLGLGVTGHASVTSECSKIANGINGKDYTR